MMTRTFLLLALVSLVLQACAQNETLENPTELKFSKRQTNFLLADFLSANQELDLAVNQVFQHLDDTAIVAQLLMPAMGRLGQSEKTIDELARKRLIGGVLLLNGTREQFSLWVKKYNHFNDSINAPSFLYSADAEPSLVNRKIIGSHPVKKANQMTSIDEVRAYTDTISMDLNEIGINYNFSPVVDMSPNKTVGYRSFGANPDNIIPWSKAFIEQSQKHEIIATAKHFPGHGLVSGDTHKSLQVINGELKEIGNYPELIASGVLSIMVAHIAVTNNPGYNTNGLPSTLSKTIVTKLLREQMAFKGLIVTDAMNMGGVINVPQCEIKAIEAGCDIILMPVKIEKTHREILTRYKSDPTFKKQVDVAAKRIIRMKLCLKN